MLEAYKVERQGGVEQLQAELRQGAKTLSINGMGGGVVEAFVAAMEKHLGKDITLIEYHEHALSDSAESQAISYIQLSVDGRRLGGVAQSQDIISASLAAILAALNKGTFE